MHFLVAMAIAAYLTITGDGVTGTAASLNDASRLREFLFNNNSYDKKCRPMMDQSVPTDVAIGFSLTSIHNLDEISQTLTTSGFLNITWLDEALRWTTGDFSNITGAMYPQCDVWKPDVALKNSVQDFKELGVPSLNVFVDWRGNVQWQPYQVFMSTCRLDVSYFPFDVQHCELTFVTWSYTRLQVTISAPENPLDLSFYQANAEWELVNSSCEIRDDVKPSVTFILTLRRKPAHVLLTVVLPVVILTVLNVCVFLLPSDSGEKASYAITVFLSFAVFSTIISSTLPDASDQTSLVQLYVTLQTVQSGVIAVLALGLIRLAKSRKRIPNCLVTLAHDRALPWRVLSNPVVEPYSSRQSGETGHVTEKDLGDSTVCVPSGEGQNSRTMSKGDDADRNDNIRGQEDMNWDDVTNFLDQLLLLVFLLISALSTAVVLLLAALTPAATY